MRIVLQGGDNMLGRAIQLTLPHQTNGDAYITDSQSAQDYLDDIGLPLPLAEIRRLNYDGSYLWGDIPLDLNEDLRIISLEAAPTRTINNNDIPSKSIHYHINIDNVTGLFSRFLRPYIFCLANNHSMDMGYTALIKETIPLLPNVVGIGVNRNEAYKPKIIGNIMISAFGAGCAGVASDWIGVAYLPPITNIENVNHAFTIISTAITTIKNKFKIISIHWGPNSSHNNDDQYYRRSLAHRLIDELGIDMIHGHSSHHVRGIELYKEKLILYGAGDFVNDYEQIPASYNRTGALYVVDIDDATKTLTNLQIIPVEMRKLSCHIVTDPIKIQEFISFVNIESQRDSTN